MTTMMTTMQEALFALLLGRARQTERIERSAEEMSRADRPPRPTMRRRAIRRLPTADELSNHLRRDIGLPPLPTQRSRW